MKPNQSIDNMRRPDQVNVRISDLGKSLLYALQDYHGVSQAAVIEMLLRKAARDIGWDLANPPRTLGGKSKNP